MDRISELFNSNLVTIATYSNIQKARFLADKLFENGIKCLLINENYKIYNTDGIKVQVKAEVVEKVVELVVELKSEIENLAFEKKPKKRILAPVINKEYSLNAAIFALGLAEKLDAEVKFLHIYRNPFADSEQVINSDDYKRFADMVIADAEQKGKEELQKFSERLQELLEKENKPKIKYHFSLIRGDKDTEIIDLSESYNPELIVLGTRGKNKTKKGLISTLTSSLIEKSKIPILAIPEDAAYKNLAHFNVLFATDFYEDNFHSFFHLEKILSPFNSKIHCIHIEYEDTLEPISEKVVELNKQFENYSNKIEVKCHYFENSNLFNNIQEFIDSQNINILSFTSPRHNVFTKQFNSSNLNKFLFHSNIPLLIFNI